MAVRLASLSSSSKAVRSKLQAALYYNRKRRKTRSQISPAKASGILSFNGNAVDAETITIGITVYRFVTVLVQAYDILIGASASLTILNLIAAINAGAGEGTEYGTGTLEHPDVVSSHSPGIMNAVAKITGPAGNTIVTTSTTISATWGAATLEGGA